MDVDMRGRRDELCSMAKSEKKNRQSDHWKGMRHSYGLLVTQTGYGLPRKREPENGNSKKSPEGRWPTSSKCGFRGWGGTSDTVDLLELPSAEHLWLLLVAI
jgi:hypothetical protein